MDYGDQLSPYYLAARPPATSASFMEQSSPHSGYKTNQEDDWPHSSLEAAGEKWDLSKGTHGTATRTGEAPSTIIPGERIGKEVHSISDPDRAYYTSVPRVDVDARDRNRGRRVEDRSEDRGWHWASEAARPQDAGVYDVPDRPVLLHVEPQGRVDLDYNLNTYGKEPEYTADALEVKDVDWIPPPHKVNWEAVGVQGTLPNENWNKYQPPAGDVSENRTKSPGEPWRPQQYNYAPVFEGVGQAPHARAPRLSKLSIISPQFTRLPGEAQLPGLEDRYSS